MPAVNNNSGRSHRPISRWEALGRRRAPPRNTMEMETGKTRRRTRKKAPSRSCPLPTPMAKCHCLHGQQGMLLANIVSQFAYTFDLFCNNFPFSIQRSKFDADFPSTPPPTRPSSTSPPNAHKSNTASLAARRCLLPKCGRQIRRHQGHHRPFALHDGEWKPRAQGNPAARGSDAEQEGGLDCFNCIHFMSENMSSF
jgi:hypothetical protein